MRSVNYFRWVIVLCSACALPLAAAVPQAFLIQNSGWMEPFYVDQDSQFKPLIKAVVNEATTAATEVVIASFNQTAGNNASPVIHFQDARTALGNQIDRIQLARKPNGALADTDFQEAVGQTISLAFKARPGIIWIFTNNKNSPNNSTETAQKNKEFYNLLHNEEAITRTLAFPIKMPVTGKLFAANGLMVYALAYGKDAEKDLLEIVRSGRIGKIFTEPPARLKPLDAESVRIVPQEIKNQTKARLSMATDQRTIIVDIDADAGYKEGDALEFVADIENLFFPYVIEQAELSAQLRAKEWQRPLTVSPARLRGLQPSKSTAVSVRMPLPDAALKSKWSISALSSMGKQVQVPVAIEVSLSNQSLGLATSFETRLKEIFPGDPLSDAFFPPTKRSSVAYIPVVIRVSYPLAPLLLAVAAALLLLVLPLVLFMLMGREKRIQVTVNERPQRLKIKAFGRVEVRTLEGEVAGEVSATPWSLKVSKQIPPHTISIR